MRTITKCMLTLALIVAGVGGAKAEKLYADLSQYGDKWDGTDVTFSWTAPWGNQLGPNLDAIGLPKGDISNWQKLVVVVDELTNCDYFRVLVYSGSDTGHNNTFKVNKTGVNEFTLAGGVDFLNQVTRICLSGSSGDDSHKDSWGETPASFKVKEVYLERPDDPLALPKDNLLTAINLGKAQNPFAKTAASWQVLTDAIAAGEAAYASASATEESLAAAKKNIEDAIAGLKLEEGYVNLTKSMFHEWSGIEDDATIKGAGGCDLAIGTSIGGGGMLYGNASVIWNQYAKLVDAKALILLGTPDGVTFGARTDRLEVGNGGGDGNGGSLTTLNLTITDGKATVDLSSKASVRINAIKNGWDAAATVTDLLVEYKPRTITVGAAGYTSFSNDLNVKAAGVTAYAAKYDEGKVKLTPVEEIPAGAGVIIKAAANNYELPVINEAAAIADNDLKVSDGTVAGDGSTIYVLANKGGKVGFYKLANGEKVPAGKAYLEITAGAPEFIGISGEATGINTVNVQKADNAIYNLGGQRVANAQKGIFIVNGKKVIK